MDADVSLKANPPAPWACSWMAWPYVVVAAIASCWIGVKLGNRYALPLLNAALAYPIFLSGVRSGWRGRTVALMLVWAVAMSVAFVWLTVTRTAAVEEVTIRGSEYRDEMFAWIQTGIGKESTPSQFIPEHALHFAIFCVVAFLTSGFVALVFGAILLNYMNFYVGSVVLHATNKPLASVIAWPPYAEIRVIGFIVVAVALTELSLRAFRRRPLEPGWRLTLAVGLGLVLLDLVLKTLIAPHLRLALSTL
ncbi:MAG: hypothetical protein HY292_22365 [Planctomycetes bacterium]|nr:hypothetical protein [Planctomycetota bacterium]